jgi:hypothetical protein
MSAATLLVILLVGVIAVLSFVGAPRRSLGAVTKGARDPIALSSIRTGGSWRGGRTPIPL